MGGWQRRAPKLQVRDSGWVCYGRAMKHHSSTEEQGPKCLLQRPGGCTPKPLAGRQASPAVALHPTRYQVPQFSGAGRHSLAHAAGRHSLAHAAGGQVEQAAALVQLGGGDGRDDGAQRQLRGAAQLGGGSGAGSQKQGCRLRRRPLPAGATRGRKAGQQTRQGARSIGTAQGRAPRPPRCARRAPPGAAPLHTTAAPVWCRAPCCCPLLSLAHASRPYLG